MTMKSIKSWVGRALGKSRRGKAALPITLSDPQALKRLQRATEDLERLVKLEKDGRNGRNLLEERLAVVHRRDIYNAKKVKQAEKENRLLAKRIDRIMHKMGPRGLKKDLRDLSIMMKAVQRALFVDPTGLSYPYNLSTQRFKLFSQNEEDGIIHAIFDKIGEGSRRFV
ncbi:MAG: hypothetical protein VX300_07105, partial [Acidobacteriota bacterium]|nr:hypothetical protein [Acidobacteriota bacterium]